MMWLYNVHIRIMPSLLSSHVFFLYSSSNKNMSSRTHEALCSTHPSIYSIKMYAYTQKINFFLSARWKILHRNNLCSLKVFFFIMWFCAIRWLQKKMKSKTQTKEHKYFNTLSISYACVFVVNIYIYTPYMNDRI